MNRHAQLPSLIPGIRPLGAVETGRVRRGWTLVLALVAAGWAQGQTAAPVMLPASYLAPRAADHSVPSASEPISDCGISRLRDTLLEQVNAARAAARSCGAIPMKAVGELGWNRSLADAAEQHSLDMASRRFFDHINPDGQQVTQRVLAQGYKWRTVGENLAGGDTTVADVIAGWLDSPEHCENMMSATYAHVGVACVRQPGSALGNYWTMVLATGIETPAPPSTVRPTLAAMEQAPEPDAPGVPPAQPNHVPEPGG